MSSVSTHDDGSIRIVFRTDSPLARALLDSERSRREPLLRHLAEEYLRLQRDSRHLFAVDPTEWVSGSSGQLPNPISVKLTITGTSELDKLMRSLPHGNWTERRQRIERLRMLAESGLAVIRRGKVVEAIGVRPDPELGEATLTQVAAKNVEPQSDQGPATWGMSIALDDSESTGFQSDPAFDLSVVVA